MNIKILLVSSIFYLVTYGVMPNNNQQSSVISAKNMGLVSLAGLGIAYGTYSFVRYAAQISPAKVDLVDFVLEDSKDHNAQNSQNYLFAHGIASTHKQVGRYASFIENKNIFTYNFPDVTTRFWRVNFWHTALGQSYEINYFKEAYGKAQIKLKSSSKIDKSLVLMGVSRGATTILNFMAQCQPQGVKALILESPFDSTRSITDNKITQWGLDFIPGMQNIGHVILSSLFWQHSRSGEQALDSIELLDKNLPILLICSKQDTLVPASSTITLYARLKAVGHKNTHIFIAEQGKHGKILEGPDREHYQKAVHDFNQKYGIGVSAAQKQIVQH